MATAENLFPDLHHKMSKKIAQLTKVIYHLNSKNEDHTDDLNALADAYETEIDGVSDALQAQVRGLTCRCFPCVLSCRNQILKDAYTKINKFKEKLEERKEVDRQQQAVDEFKKQHEKEKAEAIEAFENFKASAKEREKELKAGYEDRINKMVKEMDSMKAEFKKRVDEFNNAVKKLDSQGGEQVEELKRKHAQEISDHVKQANAKYNEVNMRFLAPLLPLEPCGPSLLNPVDRPMSETLKLFASLPSFPSLPSS